MNAVSYIPLPPPAKRGRKCSPEHLTLKSMAEGPVGGCMVFRLGHFGIHDQRRLSWRVSALAQAVAGNGWYATRYLEDGGVGIWKVSDGQGRREANNLSALADCG